jgi:hypothetical protein
VKRDVRHENEHRYYEHDTTNADVIANLGSKVASLLNLDLDTVDSRCSKYEKLKGQLDSIHKTKSVKEIDKLSYKLYGR